MDTPIAVTKQDITKDDIKEYYNILNSIGSKKKQQIIFDILFIVCGAAFIISMAIGYIIDVPFNAEVLWAQIIIILLVIWHFVRKPVIRNRYVNILYKQINENKTDNDCTEYYSDKIVIRKSDSIIEISYSDIEKSYETADIFVIHPKVGLNLIGKKNSFTKGSFEDIRKLIHL